MPYRVLDQTAAAAAPVTTLGAPLTSQGETLEDFRESILEELGNRTDLTVGQLDKWINWGYRHVCSMLDLKELDGSLVVDTVSDQPFYLLPPQVGYIHVAAIADSTTYYQGGRLLEMIDREKYRMLPDEDDEPKAYFRHGRMLVLWPDPSTADLGIAVDFKIRPDDLEDLTDSPILPTEWHEAIMLAGKYRALRATRQFAAAQAAMNEMVALIRPIEDTDAQERLAQNAQVVPVRHAAQLYRAGFSRRRFQ